MPSRRDERRKKKIDEAREAVKRAMKEVWDYVDIDLQPKVTQEGEYVFKLNLTDKDKRILLSDLVIDWDRLEVYLAEDTVSLIIYDPDRDEELFRIVKMRPSIVPNQYKEYKENLAMIARWQQRERKELEESENDEGGESR